MLDQELYKDNVKIIVNFFLCCYQMYIEQTENSTHKDKKYKRLQKLFKQNL